MPKKELSRFIVYQPNQKEFHICLEVRNEYFRWCSYYAPTQDVRFSRKVNRISNLPSKKIPKKNVYDHGYYALTQGDNKETVDKKISEKMKHKSFSFILYGKKLRGRFTLKQTSAGTILQKYKDKYATEEDILSEDLSRTISLMVPDYDETKVSLSDDEPVTEEKELIEEESVEELTPYKTIGKTEYYFALYTSEEEPDIYLVTNEKGEALVFQKTDAGWEMIAGVSGAVRKREHEFRDHIEALSELSEE